MKLATMSKTTILGWLTAIIGTCGPLTAYFASLHDPKPWQIAAPALLTLIATCGHVYVSILSKDAGETLAISPGQKVAKMEPSHELPDDPNAIAVLEKNP